ncbi:MAG TPA: hypothetical protein VKZ83_11715, partial [Phototrophicaceae bacterium]|nr:hypothetical protein [Phototrophicaceae bacterium]
MSRRPTRVLALAGALCLGLAACTSSDPEEGTTTAAPTETPGPEQGEVQLPADATTVLPGTGGGLALAASQAFFTRAPVVVLADDADPTSQLRASSVALALGAPALLDDDGAALADELTRLDAGWVLTVGDATLGTADEGETPSEEPDGGDLVVVPAPADDDALAELLGLAAGEPVPVAQGSETAAVVGLERGE